MFEFLFNLAPQIMLGLIILAVTTLLYWLDSKESRSFLIATIFLSFYAIALTIYAFILNVQGRFMTALDVKVGLALVIIATLDLRSMKSHLLKKPIRNKKNSDNRYLRNEI